MNYRSHQTVGVREARKELMRKEAAEQRKFIDEHPEFAYTLSVLTGTVCSCRGSGLSLSNVGLFAAFEHFKVCDWCAHNYKLAAKQQLADMSA